MQINACNINPNFSSSSLDTPENYHQNIDAVLEALGQMPNEDSFTKCGCEDCLDGDTEFAIPNKNDKKNILEIGVSVLGAGIITFATGKGLVLAANKFFPNITSKLATSASGISNGVSKKITNIADSEKSSKVVKEAASGIKIAGDKITELISKSGNSVETMANAAGCVSAVVAVPTLVTSDNNEDGIKDITQKSVSMYDRYTKNMGALKSLLDIAI